jgi:hypothetical protein
MEEIHLEHCEILKLRLLNIIDHASKLTTGNVTHSKPIIKGEAEILYNELFNKDETISNNSRKAS